MQPAVTADLREISHADPRAAALAAIETCKQKHGARYARGVACRTKDTETLPAFPGSPTVPASICPLDSLPPSADRRELPAEHWDHLRTFPGAPPVQGQPPFTPIESVFATVRHRTVRTRGALSQKTARLMVLTLVRAASKTWRKLNGTNRLPSVIEGVKFPDGVAHRDPTESRAA